MKTQKYGKNTNGKQRYFCKDCHIYFQIYRSINRSKLKEIWIRFVWHRQTLKYLSREYGYSRKHLQQLFKTLTISKPQIIPEPIVLIADCTFFTRYDGLCIFYASNLKKVISYSAIRTESKAVYRNLKNKIEIQGFKIKAVVIDGRRGVKEVFSQTPIQMCQFHQISIIRRYITKKPRLEAGKELKNLVYTLCKSNKEKFISEFQNWSSKWNDFLKEKTFKEDGSWHYTHQRLRSARGSIKSNIPYLFTFEKYPELNIPNTTNELESINAKLKNLLYVHSGYKHELKTKIIQEILRKKPAIFDL